MKLIRLFDNDDRESWSKANRAIIAEIDKLSEPDRTLVMSDPDVDEKLSAYREDYESNDRFADFVLSLDFALHKHMNAKPRTYRQE